MSELALAAFAAATGCHVVSEPNDRRFERFRQEFDEAGFRERLAAAGLRWVGRSERAFPSAPIPPTLQTTRNPPKQRVSL